MAHVAVVIPVHNEEELLGDCLDHVRQSVAQLRLADPTIEASVWVVLDACTDRSAAIAEHEPSARVLVSTTARVGAARRAGVAAAIEHVGQVDQLWVANTDADSCVPPHWLVRQLALADAGADAVIGTVVPDDRISRARQREWQARHVLQEGHLHLHGANLGVRARAYVDVGGFPDVPSHEDRALVTALRRSGACCVATDSTRVRTSSRLVGRAPEGFAAYLAALPALRAPLRPAQSAALPGGPREH